MRRAQPKRLVQLVGEPYGLSNLYLPDMGLLTLSRPLRADVHGGFHSIGTDSMVALSLLVASLTY